MRFSRGKYKGRLITEIREYDPGYIRWCKENTPWMLNTPKSKVNKAEQEFASEWKQNQKQQTHLRQHLGDWSTAFGD